MIAGNLCLTDAAKTSSPRHAVHDDLTVLGGGQRPFHCQPRHLPDNPGIRYKQHRKPLNMPTLALHAFITVLRLLLPHGLALTAQHFVRVVALARAEARWARMCVEECEHLSE